MAQLKSTIISGNLSCTGIISCLDTTLTGGGYSLKQLNNLSNGSATINYNTVTASTSENAIKWIKCGHLVHVNFWVKFRSDASKTWSSYLVATGLPQSIYQWQDSPTICRDGQASDSYFSIGPNGAMTINVRMAAINDAVFCGGFSYISA